MSKICVVGGSGFLGSHVASYLTENNHDVVIFDLKKSRWLQKNQKIIIGSITDQSSLDEAFKNVEIVYNFAGIADLNDALNKPIDTVKLNILGNVNALEAAKKK